MVWSTFIRKLKIVTIYLKKIKAMAVAFEVMAVVHNLSEPLRRVDFSTL